MCNRIDKCGYHYTPKQYYTDNPWKRDDATTNNGSLRPPKQYYTDNPWKRDCGWLVGRNHRKTDQPTTQTKPHDYIPEWVWEYSRSQGIVSEHHQWLESLFSPPFYHPRLLRISANFPIFVEKIG